MATIRMTDFTIRNLMPAEAAALEAWLTDHGDWNWACLQRDIEL